MVARAAVLILVPLLVAGPVVAEAQGAPAQGTAPAAAATTPPAAAATGVSEVPLPEGRILNGHVFQPAADVPGALPTTSFASYLVIGYGKTTGSLTIGDRTYNGTFDYAGVGAVIGFEYAFLRNFSARLTINEIVYSGINGPSALVVGTTLATGGALGLTASLPLGDSLRVGVLFDAGIAPGLALTIGSGLRSVIENCKAGNCNIGNNDGVFNMNNAVTLQPALAANWAPWRPLGITANVAYLHVSQDRGDKGTFTGDAMSLGAAADFDFLAISKVPVGLQLQFSWTAPISGEGLQHITDLGGGIFYTGVKNLSLGLQLLSRRFGVQPNVDVSWSTFISNIGMRYYW